MNALTTLNTHATTTPLTLVARLDDILGADAVRSQRALRRRVLLPVVVAAALLGLWSHQAPIAGAVVASGQVRAEFGRKTVQHQEGGIVQQLFVQTGQAVLAGEPLMVVGDLRSDAALAVLSAQRDAERLRAARTRAELALAAAVDWPAEVPAANEARQREQQLFEARRRALGEQQAAQATQLAEARHREAALRSQLEASLQSAALARAELESNRPLVAEGFIQKTRLMTLERGVAELDGRSAAIRAQVADARTQAASIAQAQAQARSTYQQRAADEHKDAGARLRELDERMRPGADLAARQTVRAPVDGTVMALRVGAVGTAVGPREPLLEIAPSGESLVIEVAIDPHDIDHVQAGGAAEVRLAAFDTQRTPLLDATVRSLTPDAVSDNTNANAANAPHSAYRAQIEVSAAELARHPALRLQAGMPAEVFITTAPRSLIAYLLEPLTGFARRGLREP